MNLLSSLSKFGFSMDDQEELDITSDANQEEKNKAAEKQIEEKEPEEKDFIVTKHARCPVCNKAFPYLALRPSSLRKLEPDPDLRPRYKYIDILKYGVILCPQCGYASLAKGFKNVSDVQAGRLKTALDGKFNPIDSEPPETYTRMDAIDRYKLALVSAMAKIVKMSEKSYICMRISWLLRDEIEELKTLTSDQSMIESVKAEMDGFYKQAYNGFMQSVAKETPPYCGIASSSMSYILAYMAGYFKDYAIASKYIYELLGSKATSKQLRMKTEELKQKLLDQQKQKS